jgi:Preprotein translocase subunit SecD
MGLNEKDSIFKEEPKEKIIEDITTDSDTTEEIDDLLKDFEAESDTSEFDKIEESIPSLFTYLYPSVSREGQVFKGPVVGSSLIKDTSMVNQYLKSKESKEFLKNVKLLWGAKASDNGYLSLYAIKEKSNQKAALDGDVINDVEIQYENGKAGVRMVMNSEGAKKWKRVTAIASKDPNNKQSIAVVLDDRVYSAPTVQEEIPNGISSITGNFTTDEANDLILILKNGKLPAKTLIIEEDIIGPSLGKASINSGTTSLIFGLIIVLVFMVFYYSKAGAVSDLALIINILFI